METLAFIYSAADAETMAPEHQLRSLDELGINLPSSVQLGLAGVAALSVLTASPEAHAVVQQGDRCPAVRDVQTQLQQRGYRVGTVDGVFGDQTAIAVGEFQQRNGIAVNRQVDTATAQALGLSGEDYNPRVRCRTASASNTAPSPSNPSATNSASPPSNRPSPAPNSTASARTNAGSNAGSSPSLITVATNGSALNVRSAPSLNASVITTLTNGATVRTNGRRSNGWVGLEQGGWVAANWVRSGAGSGGSVSASSNSTSAPASTGQVRVTTNGSALNVRSGPGLDYAVTGVLPNGAVASTSGRTSGGWIQLADGGWISSSWVGGSSSQASNSTGGGGGSNAVTVATNGNPLNARYGPGYSFEVATVYFDGASLSTTGRTQSGWIQLSNGLWVASEWVE